MNPTHADRFPAHEYPWVSPDPTEPSADAVTSTAFADGSRRAGAQLVVAIGSNASGAVLRRKLGVVADTLVSVRVEVADLGVGHSAHVARGGYIPAAPVVLVGRSTVAVATWLTSDQLGMLDATEPNYDRLTVTTHDHPLTVASPRPRSAATPALPDEFMIYVSRHGVLGDAANESDTLDDSPVSPLELGDQQRAIDWLAARLDIPELHGPASLVCARLRNSGLRAAVTHDIRAAGLARHAWPAGRSADNTRTPETEANR